MNRTQRRITELEQELAEAVEAENADLCKLLNWKLAQLRNRDEYEQNKEATK